MIATALMRFLQIAVAVLMLQSLLACGRNARTELPEWLAEVQQRSQSTSSPSVFSASCRVSQEQSDDVDNLIRQGQQRRQKGQRLKNSGRSEKAGPKMADHGISFRYNWRADPRLEVLRSSTVQVESEKAAWTMQFDGSKRYVFNTDGEANSNDGNINTVMSAWENGQFIIERNGPRGQVTESWTLSPDANWLHVMVVFAPALSIKPVQIGRLFDCHSI